MSRSLVRVLFTSSPPDALERVHHHARSIRRATGVVTAVCGATRKPIPNPRALPCCPLCQLAHPVRCPGATK